MTRTITIPHLGRVEGHGAIRVALADSGVTDVNMDIHEGSRYYEKLLVGKHFRDVQGIITRVCAICSADHTVVALAAIENALGIRESRRTSVLRGLLLHGAAIESNALHVFALSLPDFLGFGSVMAMADQFPDEVAFALRLKHLGNHVQSVVGGRAVHPMNALVGGFGKLPSHHTIEELRRDLQGVVDPLMDAVNLVASIDVPDWAVRETLFVALRPPADEFGFRGDSICTSGGSEFPVEGYREALREFSVEHSHARHAALESGDTYMVGSLARIALWGDRLRGRAVRAFGELLPNGVVDNVLLNTRAQLVETVYSLESAIESCEILLGFDEAETEQQEVEGRAGKGVAAIEAPRGTLIHEYELDDDGRVTAANVVTPTAQNLANLERDLRNSGDRLLRDPGVPDAVLKRGFEMVARAYDPCISCSVHLVRDGS
jgi:sulfhydrogenase subunit alpha